MNTPKTPRPVYGPENNLPVGGDIPAFVLRWHLQHALVKTAVLYLSRDHSLIGALTPAEGEQDIALAEIFHVPAVKQACALIVLRSRPANTDISPSPSDVEWAKSVQTEGRAQGITLLDAVIVAEGLGTYSMRKRGLLAETQS